ncbi:NUDIX domain-containing protein [Candidatus Pacearchaeota archaeon]|nr:NUDIX domain-containing protein [Candidatus Pacearchaeota archaeon]
MTYDRDQAHYIVVTVIPVKEGRYLIAKRAEWEKAFPGKWTVPGGKVKVLDYALRKKDTSEHWYHVLEDVARREVLEETGLAVDALGYVTSLVYIRSDGIPCLIVSLYAEVQSDVVQLCTALSDYKWVDLEEAKQYALIEGIYEELETLDKHLKKGEKIEWKR